MEHRPRANLRATLILTAVNLIAQLLGLCCRIGISRLAGAEVMGVYQLLMPAYSVLSAFVISGLAVSVSALTGGLVGKGAYRGARRLISLALKWLCILWAVAAIPTALASDLISASFLGDARTHLGLLVLLPCLLLTGIENLQKHHFYGLGRAEFPAVVELAEQLVRTAGILLLLMAFPHRTVEQ
jgi:O-antigen/teichoic acid export membrane protein